VSVVEVGDAEAVAAYVAEVRSEDRSTWSGPARAARVVELDDVIEQLRAEQVRAVGDWDRDRAWQADEATSATNWLVARTQTTPAAASRLVAAARLAREHDVVGRALGAARVRVAHVEILARAARHRETLFARDAEMLVVAAVDHSPRELAVVARRWRHLADDAASIDDPEAVRERNFLHTSTTFGGTVRIDGELDPDGGALLLAALDRHGPPDPADDPLGPRNLAQRRADALVDIAAASLSSHGAGELPRPAIDVLVDRNTLDGLPPVNLARARADIAGVGPVPIETIRRLMCEAIVGRIAITPSEVLDAGRRLRFPNTAQRRAVIARDEHCAWPDCDRPARWCDVHHVVPYPRGGRTDVGNLVLLCRRHHRAVHERQWTISRSEDGTIRVRPPSPRAGRCAERAPPGTRA
jgi:hypothetical protein